MIRKNAHGFLPLQQTDMALTTVPVSLGHDGGPDLLTAVVDHVNAGAKQIRGDVGALRRHSRFCEDVLPVIDIFSVTAIPVCSIRPVKCTDTT